MTSELTTTLHLDDHPIAQVAAPFDPRSGLIHLDRTTVRNVSPLQARARVLVLPDRQHARRVLGAPSGTSSRVEHGSVDRPIIAVAVEGYTTLAVRSAPEPSRPGMTTPRASWVIQGIRRTRS